jgi:DNA-binding transcriptional LysR family regulator
MNHATIFHSAMNNRHDASRAAEPLAQVDLNLVVSFDALARERSVTQAARRVGVTQSAMSHALRRLRELLGDPLFVRSAGGMALTPRAEALVVPFRSSLVTLGRALTEPATFAPRASHRAFSLASPDLFDLLVVPRLLDRIRDEAPGVDLAVKGLDGERIARELETGEVDVAIMPRVEGDEGAATEAAPSGIVRRTLFRDRLVCVLRANHPALGKRKRGLSLTAYAGLSHLLVSPRGAGGGLVDDALARQGRQRRIALRVPSFSAALGIVAQTDLVLTAPTALVQAAPDPRRLTVVPVPLALPGHTVNLAWHERFAKDAGHVWFREALVNLAREVQRELERFATPR